ncbi:MAG: hypothetical protein HY746_03055 [Elusimicrobia bacterium]|nr:hypothetical protein [Elusimicrobiota bacterium]
MKREQGDKVIRRPIWQSLIFAGISSAFTLVFLTSCVRNGIDVIQVGPYFSPTNWKKIEFYTSKEQTKKSWGAVALLHGPRTESAHTKEISGQIKQARKIAAKIGADAVILIMEPVTYREGVSAEEDRSMVFLNGVAIKYAENVPQEMRGK